MRSMVQRPVLAADTVVIVDGDVLGKPANRAEAEAFLQRLSGRTHEVRTDRRPRDGRPGDEFDLGVDRDLPRHHRTTKRGATAPPPSRTTRPAATASRASQPLFIERIEGSYTGVMGLPLFETGRLLMQVGFKLL